MKGRLTDESLKTKVDDGPLDEGVGRVVRPSFSRSEEGESGKEDSDGVHGEEVLLEDLLRRGGKAGGDGERGVLRGGRGREKKARACLSKEFCFFEGGRGWWSMRGKEGS